MSAVRRYHEGSLVCGAYELRITERCLEQDLSAAVDTPIEGLEDRYDIVKAFCKDRSAHPLGGKTVGPEAGPRTLYRLQGREERGATWFDEEDRVVWLCATRLHRSGEPDDAFPYFEELLAAELIYPTEEDYERLYDERAERFVAFARDDAEAILAEADRNRQTEVRGVIGREQDVGVVVLVHYTLGELYVAFSPATLDYTRIPIVLAAFCPDRGGDDWYDSDELPTRPLEEGEICFRIDRDPE